MISFCWHHLLFTLCPGMKCRTWMYLQLRRNKPELIPLGKYKLCPGNANTSYMKYKHCQRHNGPRNWLRDLDSIWQQHGTHHFQIWPPHDTTCICFKFERQMVPLSLVANLSTRWRHLYKFHIWPPDGATCISCKFDHQMAPLALVANLATRWRHLH